MKTKTQIETQLRRKTNPELVKTIIEAKKKEKWVEVAGILSSPRVKKIDVNIDKIDKEAKEGDVIVVPGKVLSEGEISKKVKVAAFSFSEKAKEKILKAKGEVLTIMEEIKKNPTGKGIKIIK
ncbi:MAG: 50S ribosomal protein L18e [Candidatus Nanoarchaeia archaeon]|nr:50S ribosomal protein L18e [Candidatus Nanoarchaeia archaeon]MDD5358080.1 50S ribosomal protein L18e [Candidatus Nanoarchaeia archaeon]MDD5589268.1 50S ribosomal protein L18e [Candidatus Nanoarchaeia archaeon]